ncbi:MAG: RluA family pseudouridine synthase [Bdellovibrionaceae bacterium]|nr:RluA family pseudouridine synthase [Pseudobdellovibrionaceae bacterium]
MISILFEDDYLILVNKPAMVLSQPSIRASNNTKLPIKELIEKQRPDLKGMLFLHHRLDYETSGVFLMSKSSLVNKSLTEMFTNHSFHKVYLCLSKLHELKPGKKVTCEIKSETSWKINNYMAPAHGLKQKRMISVKAGKWPAETDFTVLSSKDRFHYIEAVPKTGRTHQIRQHLQESNRSILGDMIYGGKSEDVKRLMLHAFNLSFIHPKTKEKLSIEAPLPQDFLELL